MPENQPDYLILHCLPDQIKDGWHPLQISHWHPYRDDYGEKVSIYFLVTDQPNLPPLLQWIGPQVATKGNKTGRLLKALAIPLSHGNTTDPASLIGLTVSGLIHELPQPEGRVKVILDFQPLTPEKPHGTSS